MSNKYVRFYDKLDKSCAIIYKRFVVGISPILKAVYWSRNVLSIPDNKTHIRMTEYIVVLSLYHS